MAGPITDYMHVKNRSEVGLGNILYGYIESFTTWKKRKKKKNVLAGIK